jgi:polar amino acid transport system substrate-binding protein
VLFNLSEKMAGSSVLDGHPGTDPHAMALPKGKDAGLAFARKFIADAKAGGLVARAIEHAGLRGVVIAGSR